MITKTQDWKRFKTNPLLLLPRCRIQFSFVEIHPGKSKKNDFSQENMLWFFTDVTIKMILIDLIDNKNKQTNKQNILASQMESNRSK